MKLKGKYSEAIFWLKKSLQEAEKELDIFKSGFGTEVARLTHELQQKDQKIEQLKQSHADLVPKLQQYLEESQDSGGLAQKLEQKERTIVDLKNENRRLRIQMEKWKKLIDLEGESVENEENKFNHLVYGLDRAKDVIISEKLKRKENQMVAQKARKQLLEKQKELNMLRSATEAKVNSLMSEREKLKGKSKKRKREYQNLYDELHQCKSDKPFSRAKRSNGGGSKRRRTEVYSEESSSSDYSSDDDVPLPYSSAPLHDSPIVVDLISSD
eukprot:CAMPEP_0174275794 /NCGR_PEP_ID=MMETSP0439-20130205/60028_1 /TAXON_ID=0 /ORGANISM="Stereomyxa ramosa, Strain Chinc5" /LENGTH=269 /DNA_ID=CAMNT_0015367951 /DNA_START=756 /DNA_END=1565 /DNA_ORIENTATION=-